MENDELYCIWSKLKSLTLSDSEPVKSTDIDPVVAPHSPSVESSASVFDDIIQYPNPPAKVNQ